ncbi:MAG: hypothetical protein SFW62_09150 [Alphaproteobacteria bacterium]|nr:hypothetical protein [Alphaproteobacteria bacterium]
MVDTPQTEDPLKEQRDELRRLMANIPMDSAMQRHAERAIATMSGDRLAVAKAHLDRAMEGLAEFQQLLGEIRSKKPALEEPSP